MLKFSALMKRLAQSPDAKVKKILFSDGSHDYVIIQAEADLLNTSFHFYEGYFDKKVKCILTFDTLKMNVFNALLHEGEKDNATLEAAIENVFNVLSGLSPKELESAIEKYKDDPRTIALSRTLCSHDLKST